MARTIKWAIPGIREILLVRASDLPGGLIARQAAGLPVIVALPAKSVGFFGTPVCQIVEKRLKSGVQYKTTLTFDSSDLISYAEQLAWLVVDNDGNAKLLGRHEDPAPRIEVDSTSGQFSGRKGITYTVTCITPPIDVVYAISGNLQ